MKHILQVYIYTRLRSIFQHDNIIQLLSDVKLCQCKIFNHFTGVGEIFDRVVIEVIQKMKEMKMVSFDQIKAYLHHKFLAGSIIYSYFHNIYF